MFKNEKEIEFTSHFTSPTLGNVYPTKRAVLPAKQADKYIAAGVAVDVDASAKPAGKPAGDPYAGMTAAQKKKAVAEAEKKAKADKEKADAIAAKQARLDELMAKDGLSDDEADEAEALEKELAELKA